MYFLKFSGIYSHFLSQHCQSGHHFCIKLSFLQPFTFTELPPNHWNASHFPLIWKLRFFSLVNHLIVFKRPLHMLYVNKSYIFVKSMAINYFKIWKWLIFDQKVTLRGFGNHPELQDQKTLRINCANAVNSKHITKGFVMRNKECSIYLHWKNGCFCSYVLLALTAEAELTSCNRYNLSSLPSPKKAKSEFSGLSNRLCLHFMCTNGT